MLDTYAHVPWIDNAGRLRTASGPWTPPATAPDYTEVPWDSDDDHAEIMGRTVVRPQDAATPQEVDHTVHIPHSLT